MSKSYPFSLTGAITCSLLIVGCATMPDPQTQADNRATEILAGTTWSDTGGNVELQFDEDARLTSISGPGMPDGFDDITLNGEPFQITVPEVCQYLGGEVVTLSFEAAQPLLLDLDDGSGNMSLEMELVGWADIDLGLPFVPQIALTITGLAQPTADGLQLIDLVGDISAIAAGIEIPLYSTPLSPGIPIVRVN